MIKEMNQRRLGNLDILRALAALSVCLFHFRRDGISATLFCRGFLGVDVFFVISGFVIPLMLSKMKYGFADCGSFLQARLLRLYPAYAMAGLSAIGLWYLSSRVPGFRGDFPSLSPSALIANALLICDFTGDGWIIPVFWTLAIEAQYYVLIAATFPLLTSGSKWIRHGVLILWISLPLIAGVGPTVFTWTALFSLGILCFLWRDMQLNRCGFWLLFGAALASHALAKGSISATVGAATGLAILYLPELRLRFLIWIGSISYSLYLIHLFVGGGFFLLKNNFVRRQRNS